MPENLQAYACASFKRGTKHAVRIKLEPFLSSSGAMDRFTNKTELDADQ